MAQHHHHESLSRHSILQHKYWVALRISQGPQHQMPSSVYTVAFNDDRHTHTHLHRPIAPPTAATKIAYTDAHHLFMSLGTESGVASKLFGSWHVLYVGGQWLTLWHYAVEMRKSDYICRLCKNIAFRWHLREIALISGFDIHGCDTFVYTK